MRDLPIILAALLCTIAPASAQVTVDLHALDQLPAGSPAPVPHPVQRAKPRPKVTLAPTTTASVAPVAASPAAPPPVAPEPVAPPAAPTAPPPLPAMPLPVAAAPKPAVASIRVPFGPDQTELSTDGAAAIKELVHAASDSGVSSYNVAAYADGSADDPSSGRRLSLARALAARAALMGNGIPSSHINVRALGGRVGDGPPDRVDISTGSATQAGSP